MPVNSMMVIDDSSMLYLQRETGTGAGFRYAAVTAIFGCDIGPMVCPAQELASVRAVTLPMPRICRGSRTSCESGLASC